MDVRARSRHGWIEVITGSMFSGKSEELIRRLRRAQIARQRSRSSSRASTTGTARTTSCRTATCGSRRRTSRNSKELLAQVAEDTEVVGIDEGQFFDAELPAACNTLADRGKRVIVAGLDQDYLGRPFEPMPQLLAIAEYITKTLAICMVCGEPANHTQRLVASDDRVLVGARGVRGALPPLLRPVARLGARSPPEVCGTWLGCCCCSARVPGRQPARLGAVGLFRQPPPHGAPGLAEPRPPLRSAVAIGAASACFSSTNAGFPGRPRRSARDDVPLLRRHRAAVGAIGRGFYEDGIWGERGSSPTGRSAGSAGGKSQARADRRSRKAGSACLPVPSSHYGAARRLLRDKIGQHAIHFRDAGSTSGHNDEREDA